MQTRTKGKKTTTAKAKNKRASKPISKAVLKKLSDIYFNPENPASFSSVNKLWNAVGMKIPKKVVNNWLLGQQTYTRHKPIRLKFRRNCYILDNIDELWETDLIVMGSEYDKYNDGVKYILVAIDCFSKYIFTTPLHRKTTDAIIDGFKKIFDCTERRPQRIQSDKGGEFDSRKFKKFMKDNDIIFNTTNNYDTKCSIVERVIRTIKTKLFKYLTYSNSYRYIDVFEKIVKSYNDSYHRTIKMPPSKVNDKNILLVYKNIRQSQKAPTKEKSPKLKVGDYVRIGKYKNVFTKGYKCNFTEEVFKVKTVIRRKPVVYRLVDLDGEDIEGVYYEQEVQKVVFDEGAALAIETIIKQRRKGKSLQYFVKFRGYPTKFNAWVDAKTGKKI